MSYLVVQRDRLEHTIPLATYGHVSEFVLQVCSSDAFSTPLAVTVRHGSIVLCMSWGGGQDGIKPPPAFSGLPPAISPG